MPERTVQTVFFPTFFAKALAVTFDTPKQVSVRRIVLHFPGTFPWFALRKSVAFALGVSPG